MKTEFEMKDGDGNIITEMPQEQKVEILKLIKNEIYFTLIKGVLFVTLFDMFISWGASNLITPIYHIFLMAMGYECWKQSLKFASLINTHIKLKRHFSQ